jgi:hypothetical protein
MSPLTARTPAARALSATARQVVLSSQAPGTTAVTGHRLVTSMTTVAHTRGTTNAQAVTVVALSQGSGHPPSPESSTGHSGQAGCRCVDRVVVTGRKMVARSRGLATASDRAATMVRATVSTRKSGPVRQAGRPDCGGPMPGAGRVRTARRLVLVESARRAAPACRADSARLRAEADVSPDRAATVTMAMRRPTDMAARRATATAPPRRTTAVRATTGVRRTTWVHPTTSIFRTMTVRQDTAGLSATTALRVTPRRAATTVLVVTSNAKAASPQKAAVGMPATARAGRGQVTTSGRTPTTLDAVVT